MRAVLQGGVDHPAHYRAAARGHIPAEALTTHDRSRLLWRLSGSGLSVEEIAARTRTTPYTVCRVLAEEDRRRAELAFWEMMPQALLLTEAGLAADGHEVAA